MSCGCHWHVKAEAQRQHDLPAWHALSNSLIAMLLACRYRITRILLCSLAKAKAIYGTSVLTNMHVTAICCLELSCKSLSLSHQHWHITRLDLSPPAACAHAGDGCKVPYLHTTMPFFLHPVPSPEVRSSPQPLTAHARPVCSRRRIHRHL